MREQLFKWQWRQWVYGLFGLSLVFLTGLLLSLSVDQHDIYALQSMPLWWSRVSLYCTLWFFWPFLLRRATRYKSLPRQPGRRPLATLLIGYELLFAQNMLGRIISGVSDGG